MGSFGFNPSAWVGNANAVKLGRCIKELERIYGIKHGGDRASGHNVNLKNQDDLSSELEMSKKQMSRFKSLTDLIPELPEEFQQMVMDGKVTASTASRMIARLTPEEQKQLVEQISGKEKLSAYDRSVLALKLKPIIAEKAKEQQIRKSVSQKSVEQKPIDTQKEVAKVAGVSFNKLPTLSHT